MVTHLMVYEYSYTAVLVCTVDTVALLDMVCRHSYTAAMMYKHSYTVIKLL